MSATLPARKSASRPMSWTQLVDSYDRVEVFVSRAYATPDLPDDTREQLRLALINARRTLARAGRRPVQHLRTETLS